MIGGNGGSSADLRENRGILESGRNSILSGREIYLRMIEHYQIYYILTNGQSFSCVEKNRREGDKL